MPNASPALPATPTIQTDFHILSFVPLKIRKAIFKESSPEMYDRPPWSVRFLRSSENASITFITPSRKPGARRRSTSGIIAPMKKLARVDSAFSPSVAFMRCSSPGPTQGLLSRRTAPERRPSHPTGDGWSSSATPRSRPKTSTTANCGSAPPTGRRRPPG